MLEDVTECWLLNARHMRNVPGRKTDVADSEWICQLVEHGLVRPSFVPPKPIRELRILTRHRKSEIEEHTRVAQRLDKVLQDAGIKLSSVATDILGVSGRAMLDALVAGTSDPDVLAELARGKLRKKILGFPHKTGQPLRSFLIVPRLLELHRRHVPDGTVKPFGIVPNEPFENGLARLLSGCEMGLVDEFAFE